MICITCKKEFSAIMASCGTGITWSLFICPHCGQRIAIGNYIPDCVFNDKYVKISTWNDV